MPNSEAPVGLADLTCYLRSLSIMLSAGVSLMRSLSVLAESTVCPPLREANARLAEEIQGGTTLSGAMRGFPHLFTSFLISMVRAGEIGGVLDDTLDRAAELYERQLEHRRQRFVHYATAQVLGQEYEDRFETAMEEVQERLAVQYFCYMLGVMLAAGVPVLQALAVAAEILPERLAHGVEQAREALRAGASITESLAAAGFPAGVIQLLAIGEETRDLDRLVMRAGDLLSVEIEGRLQAALGLN